MALMHDFQSLDAVPGRIPSINQETFVFQPANEFRQASPPIQQFPSNFQVQSETPAVGPFAFRNPSTFPSSSTASFDRFPNSEQSQTAFRNQIQGDSAFFSPQERDSLIGYLIGLDTESLVLTPRQKNRLKGGKQNMNTRTFHS